MSSTPKYAHSDTKRPNGTYVQIERILIDDERADRPDEMAEGFWPSRDESAAGYVFPENFESELAKAKKRMADFDAGHWHYVGVIARAKCLIVRDGIGIHVNIDSPGLWGIESDAGDYLNAVYHDQVQEVKEMLAALSAFTIESE